MAAAVGIASTTFAASPADAFGNNRWVTHPGCGQNYVSSHGDLNYAVASTQKGGNNDCGYIYAGLINGSLSWSLDGVLAQKTGPVTVKAGYHKGCASCSATVS